MSNTMNEMALAERIDELEKARKDWENGTYAAANTELYALLDRCYALYVEMRKQRKLIAYLNTLLTERGLKPQTNTSLATRIVRLVFGDCGKRAYSYANVLTVAAEEMGAAESMAKFVKRKGGVEEIRRSAANGGETRTQLKEKHIDYAADKFATGAGISGELALADELKPHKESANDYSVALIRSDANGKGVIVFGSNNQTLVRAVLEEAGKQHMSPDETDKDNEKRNGQLGKRKTLVGKFAA